MVELYWWLHLLIIHFLLSLSQELADLIRSSRDFMSSIAKAKTAKLSKPPWSALIYPG